MFYAFICVTHSSSKIYHAPVTVFLANSTWRIVSFKDRFTEMSLSMPLCKNLKQSVGYQYEAC